MCAERFDENLRVPRSLHCGHTFCEVCLQNKEPTNCPICRTKLNLFKAKKLPKNYLALYKVKDTDISNSSQLSDKKDQLKDELL